MLQAFQTFSRSLFIPFASFLDRNERSEKFKTLPVFISPTPR
jgi:hypothetical protein